MPSATWRPTRHIAAWAGPSTEPTTRVITWLKAESIVPLKLVAQAKRQTPGSPSDSGPRKVKPFSNSRRLRSQRATLLTYTKAATVPAAQAAR
jgi:hypothetical protein